MERTTYEYCIECGTDRETHEAWAGDTNLGTSTKVALSKFYADLLNDRHEHVWVLNCVCTEHTDGRESIGCGMNRLPNSLVMQYDINDEFRAFVKARIESGTVRRQALAQAIRLRDLDGNAPEAVAVRTLLREFPGEFR